MSKHVTESIELSGPVDGNTILGVKFLGPRSKNKREYGHKVREEAITLFEGAKVYVNHDNPDKNTKARRLYQDRLGTIRNVTNTTEGLFADLVFNPNHPVAPQLIWEAEHPDDGGGLSINTIQTSHINEGVEVVDKILRVKSVDLVAEPATADTIFESVDPDDDATEGTTPTSTDTTVLTVESLEASNPELVAQIRQEATATVRVNMLAALKALLDSGLSYRSWDAGLLDQIFSAETAEARAEAIEARAELAKRLTDDAKPAQESRSEAPISKPPTAPAAISHKEWARSLR